MQEASVSSPTAFRPHTRAKSSSLVTSPGARSSNAASNAAALGVSLAAPLLRCNSPVRGSKRTLPNATGATPAGDPSAFPELSRFFPMTLHRPRLTLSHGGQASATSSQEGKMLTSRFAMHLAVGALLALPLWSSAHAERTVAAAPPGAGEGPVIEEVNFPISCSPTAQKAFNHAAWTLHSFWYSEALQEFSNI